jgi:hypothetical protein
MSTTSWAIDRCQSTAADASNILSRHGKCQASNDVWDNVGLVPEGTPGISPATILAAGALRRRLRYEYAARRTTNRHPKARSPRRPPSDANVNAAAGGT